jgi:NAD-dependent SIR2 family protein deacetylase
MKEKRRVESPSVQSCSQPTPLIVFVFGAGISRDAGYPIYHDLLDPAFMDSIYDRCFTLSEEFARDHKGVIDRHRELCKRFRSDGDDMESLLEFYISEDVKKASELITYYHSLIELVDHIYGMTGIPEYFWGLWWLLMNIQKVGVRVAIISFNHDLLVENLRPTEAPEYSHYLDPRRVIALSDVTAGLTDKDGKPFNFVPERGRRFYTVSPESILTCEPIPLLKLHGSFDWIQCPQCRVLRCDPIGIFINEFNNCSQCGEKLIPTVIPPTRVKDYTGLEELWLAAELLLRQATIILFAGYSMPTYDEESFNLFHRKLHLNTKIVVVNKSTKDSLRKRYYKMAGSRSVWFVNSGFCDMMMKADWLLRYLAGLLLTP